VTVDTSGHWRFITGRETVRFFPRYGEGTFEPPDGLEVAEAKRNDLTKEEMGGDALLATYGVAWTLWKDFLEGHEPKYGDRVQDVDGIIYSVQSVKILSLRQRFRCVCLRQPGQVG